MGFSRLLLAGLLALVTLPAYADWQWSAWGMNPDDVIKASDGLATPVAPEDADIYNDNGTIYHPRARFETTLGDHSVVVDMLFDADDGLAVVMLNPAEGVDCDDLEAHLTAQLGAGSFPVEPSAFARIVRWDDGDDRVNLTSTPSIGLCNLSYRPARDGMF